MSATYDGAPRPITEDEAKQIARDEYQLSKSRGQHVCLSRGADGGMHVRETFERPLAAVVWVNARRQDLVRRLLAGDCTHTCFYDRARDRYWLG